MYQSDTLSATSVGSFILDSVGKALAPATTVVKMGIFHDTTQEGMHR